MAAENSFDIACKIDMQEVTNAIDQARRDITTRYDLKGAKNEITPEKLDILQSKLHRRGVDLKALTINDPEPGGGGVIRQKITLQDGVPMEKAKEIVRLIKDSKLKVQASIQEKQVRVVGKSRDDLQAVIALLKGKDLGIALQFTNYRST
jgi:cyclic-di-GMP-binding protein